jgi:hypothetical protein
MDNKNDRKRFHDERTRKSASARSRAVDRFWFSVLTVALTASLIACGSGQGTRPAVNGTGGSASSVGGNTGMGGTAPSPTGGASPSGSGGAASGGNRASGGGGVASGGSASGGSPGGNVGAVGSGTAGAAGGSLGTTGGALGTTGGVGGTSNSSGGAGGSVVGGAGGTDIYPLMKVLPLFSGSDVPAKGPMESAPSAKGWTSPATLPTRTGNGIAQHPILYVGENYNRIILVNQGKVAWTYDTTPGSELDDIWMLSNGNILYSHMTFIEEITPKKEVVWHYKPTTGEIHTCQPIGLEKVLFVENALPMARVRVYNKTTSAFEVDQMLDAGTDQHSEFRRFRMTGAGTYLGSFMAQGKVVEFDKDFKSIWTFTTPRPWSGVRLKNGNTLILDETQQTCKEVNSALQVVWQLKSSDFVLPAGVTFGGSQTCERLYTGNTVLFGHSSNTGNAQGVEVTATKEIAWILQDWINLGDATAAQFLDEPGYPEVPGDTNH